MANHASAEKSARQNEKRRARNIRRRSRVRAVVKALEAALKAKDFSAARAAFPAVQKELLRSVSKGVNKLGTVSRRISRLNTRVKALAGK